MQIWQMNIRFDSMKVCLLPSKIRFKKIPVKLLHVDQREKFFFLPDSQRNAFLVLHHDRVAAVSFNEMVKIKHIDQVRLVRTKEIERL